MALAKRALDLFEQALDQPDDARAAWIAAACGDDGALSAEVLHLMRADTDAAAALPTCGLDGFRAFGPLPERVGAYRITECLGEGGMGATFAAVRADGLFEHDVAIKLVRPSMLPDTARALFDKERRALAKLSHRHIAQLFDGGVTEDGAPYFVMERVFGETVDAWAKGRGAREIVETLTDVCRAVQFAHQNLIVHADLKPANILVSQAGEAKIVDFGVARILRDVEGDEAGAFFPYTSGFASPARVAGAAPTVADDVYALGALARALLREKAADARDDLDAIIARACADGAAARYHSSDALCEDLRRWLEYRPIAAREAERLYSVRKFVRRRRLRVIAAGLALFGLVGALGVTSYLYVRAEQARQLAETRFTEVRGLARYLLFDVYDRLERTPRSLAMRRDVARVAQGYLEQLADSPVAPEDVRRETIEGLVRIADIQAGRHHANLGEYEAATASLATAETLAAALPQDGAVSAIRARVALRRASLAMNVDQDLDEAARFIEAGRELAAQSPDQLLALEIGVEAATLANWQGQHGQAATLARVVIVEAESMGGAIRETHFLHARAWDALAEALYYQDDLPGAEAAYRNYVELTTAYHRAHGDDMEALRNAVRARWALGTTLLQRERHREGLAILDIAASQIPTLLSFEPADEGAQRLERIVLTARAQALAMNGRFVEGERLLRSNVQGRRALYRAAPDQAERARAYAISLAMLADLFADRRQGARACPLYDEAAGVFGELERRGQLARLDRESAVRMINERRADTCES
jgi:serine/threonine-protein kinase